MVDDAIVVIENITRYLEKGLRRCDAALRGSREIGFTVLSMSTSLIAVFIPILLMGGIVGRIFREFAITLSVAVAISMVVSLTTTPTMCASLLKPEKEGANTTGLYAPASEHSSAVRRICRQPALGIASISRWCWALSWGRSAWRFTSTSIVPKGFFPQQDTGRLNGNARASEDISFQSMRQKLMQYMAIVQKPIRPWISWPATSSGPISPDFNITAEAAIGAKVSVDQVINRLRPKVARVPGANLFLQAVQDVQIGGRMGNAQFQYTLQGDNLRDLLAWTRLWWSRSCRRSRQLQRRE